MSDVNPNEPVIDFTLAAKKRRMLYLKRPKGTPIPVGMDWRCVCDTVHKLTDAQEQYCVNCGSRLRNQENDKAENDYGTTVVVTHFRIPRAPQRR